MITISCADPEGGAGSPHPPHSRQNHKNVGFLSNTGLDPLKITMISSQNSMLGDHWPANDMPFQ